MLADDDRISVVQNLLNGAGYTCSLKSLEEIKDKEASSGILDCIFGIIGQIKVLIYYPTCLSLRV
jgi:hypothetical protein